MRGQVLQVGPGGDGIVLGDDGNRYRFLRADWKSRTAPAAGSIVDFVSADDTAREIYALAGASTASSASSAAPATPEGSSVALGIVGIICLLLGFVIPLIPTIAAFILGLVGADSAKRYNNDTGLLLSRIAWIGAVAMLVIGFIIVTFAATFALPFVIEMFNFVTSEMRDWARTA